MIGRAWLVLGLLVGLAAGCHRSSAAPVQASTGTSDAVVVDESGSPRVETKSVEDRRTDAVFSAPIAATRTGAMTVVAGLVAAKGTLRVAGWPEGEKAWSVDALQDVAWTSDAELRLEPAGAGVAVLWHGNVAGKPTHTAVLLGPRGETRGEPVVVGGSSCATASGLVWVDGAAHGPAHVSARPWIDPAAHEVATVPADRAASVLCGDHDVFLLGDGDDDLTSTTFLPEDRRAPSPVVVIRDSDFGDDDEREHHAYTAGDVLGLVRVSGSGAVALRDVSRAGLSPWRRLKHKIGPDDDVVATDGDAAATVIVFLHEIEDACDAGSTAETVRALRADRITSQDAVIDLARADCHRARGPFWLASTAGGNMVAWIERSANGSAGSAPIDAFFFGALSTDAGPPGRLELAADAVVQAGCGVTCLVAALVRTPDADGSQPEAIVLEAYP